MLKRIKSRCSLPLIGAVCVLSFGLAACATVSNGAQSGGSGLAKVFGQANSSASASGSTQRQSQAEREKEAKRQRALATYQTAGHFKAAAANPDQILGAGIEAKSLFSAERDAIDDCTRRSDYQGDCETVQVGNQRLVGLNDDQKDQFRWAYMRQVHDLLGRQTPANTNLRTKVLMPGSRVSDAILSIANGFGTGGFIRLQMPSHTCSGTMDPIERDPEEEDLNPIGLMEFACDQGDILRGGYAFIDSLNQLFFLEDSENERWDFIVSSRNPEIGNDLVAFKRLFRDIEESD